MSPCAIKDRTLMRVGNSGAEEEQEEEAGESHGGDGSSLCGKHKREKLTFTQHSAPAPPTATQSLFLCFSPGKCCGEVW